MGEHSVFEKPRWLRDFVRFLPLKSQFVLTGNVRDLQISEAAPGIFAAVPLAHVLHNELKAAEYGATLIYDLVNGFSHVGATENESSIAYLRPETAGGNTSTPAGPAALLEAIRCLQTLDGPPVALIVDFASRLLVRGDAMSDSEHRLFTHALIQSHRARTRPVGAGTPSSGLLNARETFQIGSLSTTRASAISWWLSPTIRRAPSSHHSCCDTCPKAPI